MTLLPGVKLFQAYGQTELAPVVSLLGPEHHSAQGAAAGMLRSCGRATLGIEIRIVDAHGNEVPRGTVGEIAARGPSMMQGYWNKPEQTKAALPGDGWLRTGDGAYMDDNGYLFIVDRVKDMIVTGGENVFSAEVENALASHPAVAMCAVIGIPDEQWGEAVHAVVVPKAGASASAEELIAHCQDAHRRLQVPEERRVPRRAAAVGRRQDPQDDVARAVLAGQDAARGLTRWATASTCRRPATALTAGRELAGALVELLLRTRSSAPAAGIDLRRWAGTTRRSTSGKFRVPPDVRRTPVDAGGVRCEWVEVPQSRPDGCCSTCTAAASRSASPTCTRASPRGSDAGSAAAR